MSGTSFNAETKQEFRAGWKTLFAAMFGNGSGLSGIPFYSLGVFIVPLSEAFGWTRGQLSTTGSFLTLGTAITAPIIGSIIDRFGARRVAIGSLIGLSIGYFALTQLNGVLAVFYAAWLAMALIGGGTTPVVWTRTINMWFDKGRGLALGITLTGAGICGIFAPALITKAIAAYGWQGGYAILGAFILLVSVPIIALFFRERNEGGAAVGAATAALPGLTLDEALRKPAFWIIAGSFFFVSSVITALMFNLVPLLIDRGMTPIEAASVAGILGISVAIGRVGVGFLLDMFHAPKVARLILTLCGIGVWMLVLADTPTWLIALSIVALGLGAAAEIDLVAYLTSRYFGMKAYGKIYGWQISIFYAGAATGPFAAGLAYDAFQSYQEVLYFAAGVLVLSAAVINTLPKKPAY